MRCSTACSGRSRHQFAEFVEEFLANYAEVNNKYSELLSKRSILRQHLAPFFGRMRLGDIGMREIERFKASKLKTHAKKSVNNHLTVLRKTLTTAVDWGCSSRSPGFASSISMRRTD